VSALSPIASAALAAVVVASMGRAFLGPPAPRPRRATARALLAATAGCYVGGALLVLLGATMAGAALVVAGIETSCLGAWLIRGDEDEGGGGGGGGGGDDPPPWDWDAFDRARAAWSARRTGPRAGV
jgi:hypothetical protein